jgi:hypothetical protein
MVPMTTPREPRAAEAASVSPSEIAEAIGRAMLTWQDNEAVAAELFVKLLDAGHREAARAAFFAVNGFASRLGMLKRAARSVCATRAEIDEDLLLALLERLAAANQLRNRLSHSVLRETFAEGRYQYHLEVPELAWGRRAAHERRLEVATVISAASDFQRLSDDVRAFLDANFDTPGV